MSIKVIRRNSAPHREKIPANRIDDFTSMELDTLYRVVSDEFFQTSLWGMKFGHYVYAIRVESHREMMNHFITLVNEGVMKDLLDDDWRRYAFVAQECLESAFDGDKVTEG